MSILVTSLVTFNKVPDVCNSRKGLFWLTVQCGEKPSQQDLEAAQLHVVCTVRKQREMNAPTPLLFIQSESLGQGMLSPIFLN